MAYKAERDKEIWSAGAQVSEQVWIDISVNQYDDGEPKLRIGRLLRKAGLDKQPVKLGGLTLEEMNRVFDFLKEGWKVLAETQMKSGFCTKESVRRALNESEA